MTTITLLSNGEITLFDSPPKFSEEEKNQYFILPDNEGVEFRKTHIKIGYILQQGYFLSQRKFFLPEQYHDSDIEYVTKLCGIEREINIKKNYNKFAYNRFKQLILEKYNYISFSGNKHLFEKEALELVKSPLKPKELFYASLTFLDERKIERPRYYVFEEIITNSLNFFEKKLIQAVDTNLTENQKEILDEFMRLPLRSDEDLSAKNPYLITHLKKVLQATTPGKIKQSLTDFYIIKDLHESLYSFFESNLLSQELINYYAVWVVKAEHIQFDNIQDIINKRLYVVSFISYQYKIRQDYFVDTFLQLNQKYYNDAEKSIAQNFIKKDLEYKHHEQLSNVKNIVLTLHEKYQKIRQIAHSEIYNSDKKIEQIIKITELKNNSFNEIIQKIHQLEEINIKDLKDQLLHEELTNNYRKLHNRVGGILQILKFNPETSNSEIYQAVYYFQQKNGKPEGRVPKDFLNKTEQKCLYFENGEFNYNLYKVFLFKEISNHIKAGSLNLLFSERYKSIDDYLISWERWENSKEELISRAGLDKLINPNDSLSNFKNKLAKQYSKTNESSKNNPYLKFNSKGIARVFTPKTIEETDKKEDIILKFIDKDRFIPLVNILSDIRYSIDFTSSFSHYKIKNSKSTPSEETIYAAVIALGCNIGIRKMGNISEGIGTDKLEYTIRWFFNKKNLEEANQKIISLTNSLPLSIIYLENKEKLNTSSDGQKFNIAVPFLHASHSPKYFGTGKGVSVYSFIDEKGILFYNTPINPSERESFYSIDGLFYDEDIKSGAHSTDTHGYSEIIFGICNSLGIDFTPRIKNYQDQLLYTFKEKTRIYYEKLEYKILPSKRSIHINEKIIVDQWEYILRLLCSIKLKETLPSNILKRLSSYSKQHPLYKAIKEVGRIYKTIFLLRYYDDVSLRQNIQKQLNKIELSHSFADAVFFGQNQEFRQATKEDQEIAVGCRHLIQNAIILWNYLYISEKLSLIENEKELEQQLSLLKNNSMMSWEHINMHGIYNFDIETTQSPFNMSKIKSLKIS